MASLPHLRIVSIKYWLSFHVDWLMGKKKKKKIRSLKNVHHARSILVKVVNAHGAGYNVSRVYFIMTLRCNLFFTKLGTRIGLLS